MEFNETIYQDGQSIHGAMSSVVLQITTRFTNQYTYDTLVKLVNNSNGKAEYKLKGGYAVDVFWYLKSLLNFTYVLRSDIKQIKFDRRSVERDSVDIYLASFSLLPERARYLKPTFVTGQSRILAFMDHAFEGDSSNQNLFITPFTTTLWVCVLVMLILFIMSFLLFNHLEDDPVMDKSEITFHCISTSLQKGSDYLFFRNSSRMASTIMSFAVVIIMASYSGIMTSIFAVNRYTINSVEALVNSNYKILMEYGYGSNDSTIQLMLQYLTHIPSVVTLLRKAEASNFVFQSFNEAIEEVKQTPSSYVIDEETGLNAISEQLGGYPCTWDKIPVYNLQYPWGMYMSRKNTTFHGLINSGIVRIRERGILRRIRKKWIHEPVSSCGSGSDGSFKSIAFNQIESAFNALLLVIFLISPALLLIEKCIAALVLCVHNRKNPGESSDKELYVFIPGNGNKIFVYR